MNIQHVEAYVCSYRYASLKDVTNANAGFIDRRGGWRMDSEEAVTEQGKVVSKGQGYTLLDG